MQLPEQIKTAPQPPVVFNIKKLDDGRFEVTSSAQRNVIFTQIGDGWHWFDLDNPEGEGIDIGPNDPFSQSLNALVKSSQS